MGFLSNAGARGAHQLPQDPVPRDGVTASCFRSFPRRPTVRAGTRPSALALMTLPSSAGHYCQLDAGRHDTRSPSGGDHRDAPRWRRGALQSRRTQRSVGPRRTACRGLAGGPGRELGTRAASTSPAGSGRDSSSWKLRFSGLSTAELATLPRPPGSPRPGNSEGGPRRVLGCFLSDYIRESSACGSRSLG